MNATTVSWTIALFFGCSIAFAAIRRWTSGAGAGVTLLVQAGFLVIVVAALVWFVRHRDDSGADD